LRIASPASSRVGNGGWPGLSVYTGFTERLTAFRQSLKGAGYVEGENVAIESVAGAGCGLDRPTARHDSCRVQRRGVRGQGVQKAGRRNTTKSSVKNLKAIEWVG
jgi:hypothetical protein